MRSPGRDTHESGDPDRSTSPQSDAERSPTFLRCGVGHTIVTRTDSEVSGLDSSISAEHAGGPAPLAAASADEASGSAVVSKVLSRLRVIVLNGCKTEAIGRRLLEVQAGSNLAVGARVASTRPLTTNSPAPPRSRPGRGDVS